MLTADKTYTANGVTVKDYFLTQHNPNKISLPKARTKPLLGVTIHNTPTISVKNTTMSEQYTRATVNGNMRTARIHYYVDHVEAWHNLPDNWQSWHAGQSGKLYRVQVGAFSNKENAEKLLKELQKTYPDAFIKE